MRYAHIAIVVLAISALAYAEPFEINAMSFNIRYGTANDGENSWGARRDIVVNMLKERSPDIVGMQECLDFQADYIVEKIPQYKWFGMGREADGSGERMVILYKYKLFSPVDTTNFWLSETPDVPGSSSWNSACPRMATAARFFHRRTQQFFVFCNTHLDHRSEEARQGGAKVLQDYVATFDAGMPAIITGDFNSLAEDSAAWRTLVQGNTRDAWLVADETTGPDNTWCGFAPPSPERKRRIDWVLVHGPIEVEHCETVVYEKDGHYVSDHFPVAARLRITP